MDHFGHIPEATHYTGRERRPSINLPSVGGFLANLFEGDRPEGQKRIYEVVEITLKDRLKGAT